MSEEPGFCVEMLTDSLHPMFFSLTGERQAADEKELLSKSVSLVSKVSVLSKLSVV